MHQRISVSNPYFVAHSQAICCEQLMFRSSSVTLDTEIYFSILWLDDQNLLIFDLLKELTKIPEYSDSWTYESIAVFARISFSGQLLCQNIISLEGRWSNFINKYKLSNFFLSSTYSETSDFHSNQYTKAVSIMAALPDSSVDFFQA